MLSDASCSEGSPIPAKVRTGGYRLLRTFSSAPRLVTAALMLLVLLPPSAFGEIGRAEPASNLMLKMTKRREGNLIHFFVQNLESAGVTATFESGLVNMRSSTPFPCTMTFRPGETAEAFTLSPVTAENNWTYTLTNHYTLGNYLAVHDDGYLYSLPYAPGESFRVSQAFGGSFSHSGAEEFAIDWNMPEGTAVCAARRGIVVQTKGDSRAGGPERSFEKDANYILIQHDDGTIANYAHLAPGGVKVKIGQSVETGDLIGLSGNTGFSSGPHLHLSVFKPQDGKSRKSIPIRFNIGSRPTTLVCGQSYQNQNALLLTSRTGGKGAVVWDAKSVR